MNMVGNRRCFFHEYDDLEVFQTLQFHEGTYHWIKEDPLREVFEAQLYLSFRSELENGFSIEDGDVDLESIDAFQVEHIYREDVLDAVSWGDPIWIFHFGSEAEGPLYTMVELIAGGNPMGMLFPFAGDKMIGRLCDGTIELEESFLEGEDKRRALLEVSLQALYILSEHQVGETLGEMRSSDKLLQDWFDSHLLWKGEGEGESRLSLEYFLERPSKASWQNLVNLFREWTNKTYFPSLKAATEKRLLVWPEEVKDYAPWQFRLNQERELKQHPQLTFLVKQNIPPRN